MELDLEIGWAYQLLAKFGTRVELCLEPGYLGCNKENLRTMQP